MVINVSMHSVRITSSAPIFRWFHSIRKKTFLMRHMEYFYLETKKGEKLSLSHASVLTALVT